MGWLVSLLTNGLVSLVTNGLVSLVTNGLVGLVINGLVSLVTNGLVGSVTNGLVSLVINGLVTTDVERGPLGGVGVWPAVSYIITIVSFQRYSNKNIDLVAVVIQNGNLEHTCPRFCVITW